MSIETIIYGLVDPRTDELRYVGKTIHHLNSRLRSHIDDAQVIKRRHVCAWIRALQREGLEPEVFEVDRALEDWSDREKFWIAYFRFIGCNLTNETIGGEGVPGRKHTEESKLKMSKSAKATNADPVFRQKKSETFKRVHADPEKKARIVDGIRKAFQRPEVIANSNAARVRPDVMERRVASIKATYEAEPERQVRRGQAISAGKQKPENRLKASESQKRRHAENPVSKETRDLLSKIFTGRVFSEETLRKMSESAKNRWLREKENLNPYLN